jgi:hypothetical protein
MSVRTIFSSVLMILLSSKIHKESSYVQGNFYGPREPELCLLMIFHLDLRSWEGGYGTIISLAKFWHVKEDRGGGVPLPSHARGDQRSRGGVPGSVVRLPVSSLLQARVSIKFSSCVYFTPQIFSSLPDSKLSKIQERTSEFMFKHGLAIPLWDMATVCLFIRSFNLSFCSMKGRVPDPVEPSPSHSQEYFLKAVYRAFAFYSYIFLLQLKL